MKYAYTNVVLMMIILSIFLGGCNLADPAIQEAIWTSAMEAQWFASKQGIAAVGIYHGPTGQQAIPWVGEIARLRLKSLGVTSYDNAKLVIQLIGASKGWEAIRFSDLPIRTKSLMYNRIKGGNLPPRFGALNEILLVCATAGQLWADIEPLIEYPIQIITLEEYQNLSPYQIKTGSYGVAQ